MLTSIVATLGSGMKGYADGKRQYEEDEFKREQQDRQRKAWKEEDDIKSGLADAAKPIEVKSGEVYQPQVDDEGVPMAPNPTAGTGMAAGKRYATMAGAQEAATAANTPEAQATRMADVYAQKGKPEQAMQLRASSKQSELAGFQLDEARQKHLDERYGRELDDLATQNGGFIKGMATYLTKTQLGGASGRNFVARPTEDGKQMQVIMVEPDGKESVYKSYTNDEKGELQARAEAMKADTKTKTMFLFDLNKMNTADKLAEARMAAEERRTTAAEGAARAAEKNADTNARKVDVMLARMGQQGQGAGQGGGTVSIEDQRKFNSDFAGLLPDARQAVDPKESAAMQAANNTRIAQAQGLFQANMAVGRVLTAPEAMAAQELAKDPKMVQVVGYKDQTGAITPVQIVVVNGKPVIVGMAKAGEVTPAADPKQAPAPNRSGPQRAPREGWDDSFPTMTGLGL